jgi:hypothetical protein
MTQSKKWYNNNVLTNLLLLIFFPVGLYALWKSDTIANWWKITAILIITVLIIANMSNGNKNLSESTTIAKKREKVLSQAEKDSVAFLERAQLIKERENSTILATSLVTSYINNEVAADNNFKEKKFYVEGYIENIGKDILDDIYITLKSGDMLRTVQCYIDDKNRVAELRKGQKVTIFGQCEGLMMNVLMRDCKLVENLENL